MSLNLIEKISAEDRKKIEDYISLYGTTLKSFVGVDTYLKEWADNKKKMFHLLGGNLIVKFPIAYEKPKAAIESELLALRNSLEYNDFLVKYIYMLDKYVKEEVKAAMKWIGADADFFLQDKIKGSFKYKAPSATKTLQISDGMKPLRAISKIIKYIITDEKDLKEMMALYEKIRIAQSIVYNDKLIKGNLCISIHPLDYMTMSDNNSKWTSCMSWTKPNGGCYRRGTLEMMNSNNILCCYIESEDKYHFNPIDPFDEYVWSNKKWRVLVVFNKNIIATNKQYPYHSDDLAKITIEKIQWLAKGNLGWEYKYGPELYQDMTHISYHDEMSINRDWIAFKHTTKHNIIFDTNNMYNDFINNQPELFWCVRNKVKKNTIINISGKAKCLCCNDTLLDTSDFWEEYNDRFGNTDHLLCYECYDNRVCSFCGDYDPKLKYYIMNGYDIADRVCCEHCLEARIKVCPDCGKPFDYDGELTYNIPMVKLTNKTIYAEEIRHALYGIMEIEDEAKIVKTMHMCWHCYLRKQPDYFHKEEIKKKDPKDFFYLNNLCYWFFDETYDNINEIPDEVSKYFEENLKPYTPNKDELVDF